jgi:hypothetical protein
MLRVRKLRLPVRYLADQEGWVSPCLSAPPDSALATHQATPRPAMLDEQQIQKRRPLWLALSELWLDTELSADDLERIARVMTASDLSIEQLRHVYLVEVAPVVSPNLRMVAGEWAGFDQEWLCSEIVRNLRDRQKRTRFVAWFPFTRWKMVHATERHWKRLVEPVRRLREKQHAI